jgi:release factor glutamine methyltransferase
MLSGADLQGLGEGGAAQFAIRLDRLTQGLLALPDKPEETPASTLRALWCLAAGEALSVQAAASRPLLPLEAPQQAQLDAAMALRLAGTPLAHITQRQRFMGLELLAGPQALIPRRETELLGEAAAGLLATLRGCDGPVRVVDVCTGSGNLAIGLAARAPEARVFAADLSADAVALARLNVAHTGLAARVEVREGDLLAPFAEPAFLHRVDLLVCNPPYISSGKLNTMAGEIVDFEPQLAFDGGPFGIRLLQRLIREAPDYLRPGGWLVFEVGLGQAPAIVKRLHAAGYVALRQVADAEGHTRALLAQVPGP